MKKLQVMDEKFLNLLRKHHNTCISVNVLNKSLRSIARLGLGIRVGSRKMIFRDDPETFNKPKDEALYKDTMYIFMDTVSSLVGFECTYRYLGIEDGSAFKPCIIIEKKEE